MEEKGFNQIRLIIGLIGLAMLIFVGLSGVMPVVDVCLFGLWFAVFILITRNLKCLPWTLGFTVFYVTFLFLGYHFPLLCWDAPDLKMLPQVVLYGNKLVLVLVNAFLYFLAAVAFMFLACAAISGFGAFNKKDSSLK